MIQCEMCILKPELLCFMENMARRSKAFYETIKEITSGKQDTIYRDWDFGIERPDYVLGMQFFNELLILAPYSKQQETETVVLFRLERNKKPDVWKDLVDYSMNEFESNFSEMERVEVRLKDLEKYLFQCFLTGL